MMKKKTENRYSLLKQLVVLPLLAILVMGLSNKEVRTEVLHDAGQLKVVVDGVELPADHSDLIKIDFSNGFDGGEIIRALGLEDKVVANAMSFDKNPKEDGVYCVQTSDYEVGTVPEFDEMINKPVVLVRNENFTVKGTVENGLGEAIPNAKILNNETSEEFVADEKGNFELAFNEIEKPVVLSFSAPGYYKNDVAYYGNKKELRIVLAESDSEKELTVTGKITNEDGEGIPAVAVLVKGTKIGTISDFSGNYKIKTDENSTLVFSMIDHEKQEVAIDGKSEIDVQLKPDGSGTPEQVKVVGYAKKNEVPRVDLLGNSENPPLFIVDGKESRKIDELEPDAIESISVLKDASATTLYGEKGKNGVIIITTKAAAKAKQSKNLVIIDGKAFDGELSDIDPNSIESIDVLKETSAIETYGEEAKNGVIRINTKQQEITSYKDLRYSIAKSIRYPLVLSEANATGVSKIFVKVSNDGSIEVLDKKNIENAIPVDEVVVVGYRPQNVETAEIADAQKKFDQEAKRTIKQLPKISIPELKGETLLFTIKFMLQNKEE